MSRYLTGGRRVAVALLTLLTISFAVPAMAQDEAPAREGTEFQAADLSKHKEDLSGIPFMVGAYMIIWAGLFAYLGSVRQRNVQVANQLAELKAAIDAHDERSGS